MKREEIFFNDKWSDLDQQLFWSTLNKKRNQKLYYASTKAHYISEQNCKDAIDLLSFFINEYSTKKTETLKKEKFQLVYKNAISDLCIDIGGYYEKLKDWEQAEQAYIKGEQLFYATENDDKLKPKNKYNGYLKLAQLFLDLKKPELAFKWLNQYQNALPDNIISDDVFYKLHVKVSQQTGNFSASDKLLNQHIEFNKDYSIIRPYSELESKPYIDSSDIISTNLNEAANEIIAFWEYSSRTKSLQKNKASLKLLDSELKEKSTNSELSLSINSFNVEYLNEKLLPQLGAYIGEVVISELKGQWEKQEPLMKSRIKIRKHVINPFEYSYKVIFFGHRLIEEVYNKIEKNINS